MDDFTLETFTDVHNVYLVPKYIEQSRRDIILDTWKSMKLTSHIFLLSSGTTKSHSLKSYAISKVSVLENARAVNEFLNIQKDDLWICSLPYFHIGGLSIYARALLSNIKVIDFKEKWNALSFYKLILSSKATYFSLVPTQLFDLVSLKEPCPDFVKGVFVGGDFLSSTLRDKALELGWPLIGTYGMTECSSQLASSYLTKSFDGFLEVLSIHKITEGTKLFSKSLASYIIEIYDEKVDIRSLNKQEEGFSLPDKINLTIRDDKTFVKPLGRVGEEFKINGRLLNFLELKDIAYSLFDKFDLLNKADIQITSDDRSGNALIVIYEQTAIDNLDIFKQQMRLALGSHIPIHFKGIRKIALTATGKIMKGSSLA